MTVILINKDVADLRVEIRWGRNNITEAFAIEEGGFGGLDIDAYGHIPDGAKCEIYAWKDGTDLSFHPEKTFRYYEGRGQAGSYTFVNELFTKAGRQAA